MVSNQEKVMIIRKKKCCKTRKIKVCKKNLKKLALTFDFVNKIHHLHKIESKLYPVLTFPRLLLY